MSRRAYPRLVFARLDDSRALLDDTRALRAMQAAGATIAIVTARDFHSASAWMIELGLDPWIVAADGAYVGRTRALLARQSIPACDVAPALEHLGHRGLPALAIAELGAHGDDALAATLLPERVPRLASAPALGDVGAILSIGAREIVDAARRTLEREPRLEVAVADLGERSALRVRSRRATLGSAIRALGTRIRARSTSTLFAGRVARPFADPSVEQAVRMIVEEGAVAALARWNERPALARSL